MVTMPVMVALDVVDNRDGNALSRIEDKTTAFGFPLRFDSEHSRINNDGAYIRYDVMSEHEGWENDVVGRIDYYYNAKHQTFSYRQLIALTIDPSDFAEKIGYDVPKAVYQTVVLLIQYDDVAIDGVELNGMVSFSTAEFDQNGQIVPNVTINQINFGNISFYSDATVSQIRYDENVFFMSKYSPIIRSADGKYASINLPYTSEIYNDEANYPAEMDSLIKSVAGDNRRIDNVIEARNVDLDFAVDVLEALYQKPYKHDTYNSYGNFTSDNIDKVRGITLMPAGSFAQQSDTYNFSAVGPQPTIYDFENGEIATYQNMTNGTVGLYIFEDSAYNATNFGSFFGNLSFSNPDNRQNSIRTLVKNLLELCGVSDDTYAENYYLMVKQSARRMENAQLVWYTGLPITSSDNPSDYEAALIEKYKTLVPTSVQYEEQWSESI